MALSVQRVLAYVALAGCAVGRSQCAGALWEYDTQERASSNLRTALWRLKRACGPLVIRQGDQLQLDSELRVDVIDLASHCQRLIHSAPVLDQEMAQPILVDSVLLPTWGDTWLIAERERLRLLRVQALEQAAAQLSGDYPAAALVAAMAAVRTEPLRESAWRLAVRIHLDLGNLAAGRRAYEEYRALLWNELGVEPTALMKTLIAPVARPERGG